ncbi:MAG: Gfo/Idh/MocA family oxidoreductase [Candidatus Hydrogenedentes bacterium]|nr:Gfo/Idh/MocA family oxidoreductase [Candidatus Hydrogenedentota bacterium]
MKRSSSFQEMTRRSFLNSATTTLGGLVVLPNLISRRAQAAPSERMGIGVIGMGGRGMRVMESFLQQPDTQVRAVCDVYAEKRLAAKAKVDEFYGNQDCTAHIDFLEILARPDIDSVLIATGDNWHSGVSLMAARAGKDIYCEKPMSVALTESRAVADIMPRLGRIFQCGTQRRSIANFRFAVHLARSGKLGQLKELHAEEAPGMKEIYSTVLPEEPLPPREVFDWDRWLGPSPWRPYNHEYPTRGFWSAHVDWSGASITEWGSHTVDLCQWANNTDHTGPTEFWKEADRWIGQYKDGVKVILRNGLRFGSCPVRFEGEEGWVETGDSGEIEAYPKSLLGNKGFEGGYPPENHVRAFLDCVLTREQPVSTAEVAHRSISVCHVANICKRLGRPIKWDPDTETCIGDDEANRLLSRAYRAPWYL